MQKKHLWVSALNPKLNPVIMVQSDAILAFRYQQKKNDENTVWLNCVAYNDIAEAFAEVCKKGCQVKVSGKFFQYEYNANIYTKFYVRDFLKLADPKPRNDNEEV